MSLQAPEQLLEEKQETVPNPSSRRRHARYSFLRVADWDYFTEGSGAKVGFIENLSQGGCLFRCSEPIESRRWLRLMVSEPGSNVTFTAVGRILRREERMEAWNNEHITLYRYGIELIHALNPAVLQSIQASCGRCTVCGDPSANIPAIGQPNMVVCVMCHLRRACQNLISQEGLNSA